MGNLHRARTKDWLGTALAVASLAAAAQDGAVPSLEQLLGTEVVTASRFAQPQTQAPTSVEVVTADQINALGYRSLTDALRGIAGIHLTNDRFYEYLGVNGLSNLGDYNSRILVLLDGTRLNEPLYDQAPIGWMLPVDLTLVERIEFVRGPGSSLYGSNALYGVINVITKRKAASSAGIAGGTYGLKEARTNLAGETATGLRYQLAASRQIKRGQTFAFQEYAAPGEPAPTVSLDREHASRFMASIQGDVWSVRSSYIERYKQSPTGAYGAVFGDPRNDARDTYYINEAALQHRFPSGLSWNNRLTLGRYVYVGLFPFEREPGITGLATDEGTAHWVSAESVMDYTLSSAYRVVGGLDLQRNLKIKQRSGNIGETPVLDDQRSTSRIGVFAQLEAKFSPYVSGSLGLRADQTDNNRAISPRLAALWNPRKDLTLRLSSARAFRAPNAYESYYSYVTSSEGVLNIKVSAGLEAETLVQNELSADYQATPTLKLSSALFSAKSKDQIVYAVQDGVAQYQNASGVVTEGARVGMEGILPGGGRYKLGASRQSARDVDVPGVRLNTPRVGAQAQMIMPVGMGWTVGSELLYIGPRRGKSTIVPSYALLNVSISKIDVIRDLDVTFSVFNALNRRVLDPAGDELVQEQLEQARRELRLQLDYRF